MTHPKDRSRMEAKKRRAAAKVRRAHDIELARYYESRAAHDPRSSLVAYETWTLPPNPSG